MIMVLQVTVILSVPTRKRGELGSRTVNSADCETQPALLVTVELEQDNEVGDRRHNNGKGTHCPLYHHEH